MIACFKKQSILVLFFLASFSSLFGAIWLSPGSYEINGEVLFLKPSFDDTYYATGSSNVPFVLPQGTRENNPFGFRPGYRLEGVYTFCNGINDARFAWTYLQADAHRLLTSPSPGSIQPTIGQPSITQLNLISADSHIKMHYYALDAVLRQLLLTGCLYDFSLRGGVRYYHINAKEKLKYLPGVLLLDEVSEDRNVYGVGPEVGFDFNFTFPAYCMKWIPCADQGELFFSAEILSGLFANHSRSKYLQKADFSTSILSSNPKDRATWRLVPMWAMRFSLDYAFCFYKIGAIAGIGYEFNSYIRALPKTFFLGSGSFGFTDYSNFDYHGPFVHLGVHY